MHPEGIPRHGQPTSANGCGGCSGSAMERGAQCREAGGGGNAGVTNAAAIPSVYDLVWRGFDPDAEAHVLAAGGQPLNPPGNGE